MLPLLRSHLCDRHEGCPALGLRPVQQHLPIAGEHPGAGVARSPMLLLNDSLEADSCSLAFHRELFRFAKGLADQGPTAPAPIISRPPAKVLAAGRGQARASAAHVGFVSTREAEARWAK